MSIQSEITRLLGAKADMKTAIEGQGVTVPSATLVDGYPELITQIGGAVDLSHRTVFGEITAKQNTANSYVVKTAGTYKIPLVYGNGIKNSRVNAQAYTRQGDTYTADFVNHLGNTLTSPYIEKNTGCTAASAGLLWQTTSGMISSVSLVDGLNCRYLQFTVASVPTTNGLAVLWVKDANGDIMWSWTIWLTKEVQPNITLTNHTEIEYEMMGLPFGAIWDSGKTHYVVPHYQWGRKDPMVPAAAYNLTSNMTVYDISGNTYTEFGTYGVNNDADAGGTVRSVANSIKMPNKSFLVYDTTSYNWNNLSWFNNFWNAAETANSSIGDNQHSAVKTIYDPCPANHMLPASRFATGFTTTGGNTSTLSEFNVIGDWSNGWTMKKNSSDTVGLYFPAAGYRSRESGGLRYVGSYGNWWTFAPDSKTYAHYLYFHSTNVYPLYYYNRAHGFGVWPTKELN